MKEAIKTLIVEYGVRDLFLLDKLTDDDRTETVCGAITEVRDEYGYPRTNTSYLTDLEELPHPITRYVPPIITVKAEDVRPGDKFFDYVNLEVVEVWRVLLTENGVILEAAYSRGGGMTLRYGEEVDIVRG